ncbi:MAG: DnaJ domain-containing protein [Chloroflexota bacterium]
MPRRDPCQVLGVPPDASPAAIKAAWRRLAREHHPDLAIADPAAARSATRRMAEINAAYEELRRRAEPGIGAGARPRPAGRPGGAGGAGRAGAGAPGSGAPGAGHPGGGRPEGGPPRPRPGRPVTARLDTSDTFRPRNQTTTRASRVSHPPGQPPRRAQRVEREPPRASEPTGPLRRARLRRFRPPEAPTLEQALARQIEFGKFRGHTLGEIAAFEPSYIDWIAGTITRDPDLVAAARVIRADLDARGIARPRRAERIGGQAPG